MHAYMHADIGAYLDRSKNRVRNNKLVENQENIHIGICMFE